VDAPVAPGRVLTGQPDDEGGGTSRDLGSTGPAVWVGPASSHEVPVPAQQRGRLDEEPSETGPREGPRQPGEQRPVYRPQGWTVDLAAQHCHLVTQHDDFDRQNRPERGTRGGRRPSRGTRAPSGNPRSWRAMTPKVLVASADDLLGTYRLMRGRRRQRG